ncbi:MAG TPA: hypothetical protein VH300_10335 [Thermoleophilaceae bacterium]|jgi:hypothetical protein|nr:hypothetical protein [Thermoleophilaceae bacterium]
MIRQRITFANVTSFVALFVALSAGSYAAIKLPANSVGSKQIKAKAVTNAKLRSNAVTKSKLARNAVSTAKIAANAVDGLKVKDGSLTGADLNLPTLGKVPSAATADSAGSAAIVRVKQVTATGTNAPAPPNDVDVASAIATCDAGLTVVGGGVFVADKAAQAIADSFPSSTSAWTADVYNLGSGTPTFTVYAVCAPASSTQ